MNQNNQNSNWKKYWDLETCRKSQKRSRNSNLVIWCTNIQPKSFSAPPFNVTTGFAITCNNRKQPIIQAKACLAFGFKDADIFPCKNCKTQSIFSPAISNFMRISIYFVRFLFPDMLIKAQIPDLIFSLKVCDFAKFEEFLFISA